MPRPVLDAGLPGSPQSGEAVSPAHCSLGSEDRGRNPLNRVWEDAMEP